MCYIVFRAVLFYILNIHIIGIFLTFEKVSFISALAEMTGRLGPLSVGTWPLPLCGLFSRVAWLMWWLRAPKSSNIEDSRPSLALAAFYCNFLWIYLKFYQVDYILEFQAVISSMEDRSMTELGVGRKFFTHSITYQVAYLIWLIFKKEIEIQSIHAKSSVELEFTHTYTRTHTHTHTYLLYHLKDATWRYSSFWLLSLRFCWLVHFYLYSSALSVLAWERKRKQLYWYCCLWELSKQERNQPKQWHSF